MAEPVPISNLWIGRYLPAPKYPKATPPITPISGPYTGTGWTPGGGWTPSGGGVQTPMPHTNIIFNPSPRNFGFPKKTPSFKTIIHTPASNRGELRTSLQPFPTWEYDFPLNYAAGAEQIAGSVYQYLLGLYLQMGGQFSDFLYQDPNDSAAQNEAFGTGDGSTTAFQLIRSIGTATDIVQNLNGSINVYVNGTLVTDFTVGATGIVTFTSAPAANAALTWTGNFYYRLRFLDASQGFEQFMQQLWTSNSLKMISVLQ